MRLCGSDFSMLTKAEANGRTAANHLLYLASALAMRRRTANSRTPITCNTASERQATPPNPIPTMKWRAYSARLERLSGCKRWILARPHHVHDDDDERCDAVLRLRRPPHGHGHWIASPLMARSSRPCPPGDAPL